MSTTLKDPNSAENDAKEKLQDPYRHKSLPSNGDADSPYANPEDIKKDIADRSVIGDAERNARPTNQEASIDQRENAGHSWTNNVSEKAKSDAISKKFLKKKGVWILFGVGGVSIFSIFDNPNLVMFILFLFRPNLTNISFRFSFVIEIISVFFQNFIFKYNSILFAW